MNIYDNNADPSQVTSLPFLVFSGPITDLVGHINVIILGMVAYTVRMVGYSYLREPDDVYPYEALEGFTMALMMTSAVTYVAKISTPTTIASVMGLMVTNRVKSKAFNKYLHRDPCSLVSGKGQEVYLVDC